MTALNIEEIETSAQLAAALKQLCGTRSLRAIQGSANELPARGGRISALPTSTVGDVLAGKSLPSVDTLITLLWVCQVSEPAQQAWLAARDRVAHRHHRRPPGAVRVRDARPRVLGVHAAIQTDHTQHSGQAGERRSEEDGLPPYVPRDLDADLRTQLTVAEQQGGFVLLVGGSSVGKTRALFEAVRAVLPNWWLLHPAGPDGLRQAAAAPTDRTVVWLDELQNYLDHPDRLPAAVIRDLINAGTVVVATLWPGEHSKRVTRPADRQPDPYAGDRQVLALAEVVTVPATFSSTERHRAEDLANTNPRIRIALDTLGAGFTQVMAAGPALIQHWEQAPADQCYGQAVITAALDARRVGAHAPATRAYLEAAAPGYLTDRQQADAPAGWLNNALAYATTLLHGATATLCPVAAGMGRIAGYQVADYLYQHALRVRRTEHLPDTAWHALVQHRHPDDAIRLADNAQHRGRLDEAMVILNLADNGDLKAAVRIADLLAKQGRIDELTHRADTGDGHATYRLVDLLAERGRIDEALTRLQFRADTGDSYAAYMLVGLLAEQGRIDELTYLADGDFADATHRLADLLAERGRIDEALTRLRPLADAGSYFAALRLVGLLAEHGRIDELTHRADTGDGNAANELVDLMAKHGRIDELTHLADGGHSFAALRLVELLAEQGRIEEALTRLQDLADGGRADATHRLADLLAEHGRIDEALTRLRPLADVGDRVAALRLVDLLAKHGRIDELRGEVAAGTPGAYEKLRALDEPQRTDRQERSQIL